MLVACYSAISSTEGTSSRKKYIGLESYLDGDSEISEITVFSHPETRGVPPFLAFLQLFLLASDGAVG